MDGEPAAMPPHVLDAHVAACPSCRNWQAAALAVTRRARVAPAVTTPDVTRAVLERLGETAGSPRGRPAWIVPVARAVLCALGAVQMALSLPALVGGVATLSAPAHVARESGSWSIALAAAFVAVAGVPRLAAGALPVLGAFTVVLGSVTVPDLISGQVPTGRAAGHLLILAGTLAVAVLAWRGRRIGHSPDGVTRRVRRRRSEADRYRSALRTTS